MKGKGKGKKADAAEPKAEGKAKGKGKKADAAEGKGKKKGGFEFE